MTTIILTIIGILLAAAAALMVIFYGGDAFNSGSTGAAANTYQNAGTNVVSAIQLYKVERGSATGANLNAATDAGSLLNPACTTGGACLKELPSVPETVTGSAPELAVSAGQFTITNVSRDVCERINKNLKITAAPASPTTTNKMACALPTSGNGTFFANA